MSEASENIIAKLEHDNPATVYAINRYSKVHSHWYLGRNDKVIWDVIFFAIGVSPELEKALRQYSIETIRRIMQKEREGRKTK